MEVPTNVLSPNAQPLSQPCIEPAETALVRREEYLMTSENPEARSLSPDEIV